MGPPNYVIFCYFWGKCGKFTLVNYIIMVPLIKILHSTILPCSKIHVMQGPSCRWNNPLWSLQHLDRIMVFIHLRSIRHWPNMKNVASVDPWGGLQSSVKNAFFWVASNFPYPMSTTLSAPAHINTAYAFMSVAEE